MTEHVKTKCVSLEYPEGSSWSREVIPLIPQLLSQLPLLHRWVHSPQLDSQRLKIEIVLFPECLSSQKSHLVYHLLNVLFLCVCLSCCCCIGQFLQPCFHLACLWLLSRSELCPSNHLLPSDTASAPLICSNETPTTIPFPWASFSLSMEEII